MSEKFNLSWNDFKDSVSGSFKILRDEKDFFDVTLVTDDEISIEAHKVVLSASSPFFKNILRKSQKSHPLVYLSGVHSRDLQFVMDYVYQGQIQIYQDYLDSFMDCATKLKISGLTGQEKYEEVNPDTTSNMDLEQREETFKQEIPEYDTTKTRNSSERRTAMPRQRRSQGNEKSLVFPSEGSNVDIESLERQLEENVLKEGIMFSCFLCGKTSNQKITIKNHIEAVHMDGLSFPCSMCSTVSRCRVNLRNHISKKHRL